MKKLSDFADEINKCSKCGLCQSVCPIYKITGNDCAVSRGKFVMLEGVIKGDLKFNKTIEKYLDMCLKCGKCKGFCPSGIDVCEIFNVAKYECAKNTFHWRVEKFLESKFVFGSILKVFKLISSSASLKSFRQVQNDKKTKLLYFKGCVNNIYPKTEKSLKKILSKFDVELMEKDFECCGLPFLSSGNLERFNEVKARNLELLNCEYDYILTDCASCESTLKQYLPDGSFINALEFISTQNVKFRFKKPVRVTFHKPCHLDNVEILSSLLGKCENIEYVEMKDFDECCGFAGAFALKNPKLSSEMTKKKAENIIETNADYVLTTCPACLLGLRQGFILKNKKAPKIMNIVDFLALSSIEI